MTTAAATKLSELDAALRYFAETYHGAVVGSEWEDACDYAETVAENFRWQADSVMRCGPQSDAVVAHYLYSEASRYADM